LVAPTRLIPPCSAFTLFAVAVDGFKIYYAWNTAAQINAAIPKIKVEDMSTDSKEAMR
jgi:hypothetical protein